MNNSRFWTLQDPVGAGPDGKFKEFRDGDCTGSKIMKCPNKIKEEHFLRLH